MSDSEYITLIDNIIQADYLARRNELLGLPSTEDQRTNISALTEALEEARR